MKSSLGLTLEIPRSFDPRKHPMGNLFTLPQISLPTSPKRPRFSYVLSARHLRGIIEGYFGEKIFVLGQSSATLWNEM